MPAECFPGNDAQMLEDWDVVNIHDLPCHESVLPGGIVSNINESPVVLSRSSTSVGSKSLFSNFASRLAKAFNGSSNSAKVGRQDSVDKMTHTSGVFSDSSPAHETYGECHLSSDNQQLDSSPILSKQFSLPILCEKDDYSVKASDLINYMDALGCITMRAELKKDVFERGVDASIRQLVWPILLGVYSPSMTQNERYAWMKYRCSDYTSLRREWQNLLVDHPPCKKGTSEPDALSFIRSIVCAVRKDALRTDRSHPMFAADNSPWTTALFNLLVTFAFAHPSIGYCQGMSDIATPLLLVMRDEATAYVCFCALMGRVHHHFSPSDDRSMASKFTALALLLRRYSPRLHQFLVEQSADDLLFTYRWLFLETKREFPLDDCVRVLESIWATVPDQFLPGVTSPLVLAETDYRKRASVLTGDFSSLNYRKQEANQHQEPPLFENSEAVGERPPRRLISCATAARCGSQYLLDRNLILSHNESLRSQLRPGSDLGGWQTTSSPWSFGGMAFSLHHNQWHNHRRQLLNSSIFSSHTPSRRISKRRHRSSLRHPHMSPQRLKYSTSAMDTTGDSAVATAMSSAAEYDDCPNSTSEYDRVSSSLTSVSSLSYSISGAHQPESPGDVQCESDSELDRATMLASPLHENHHRKSSDSIDSGTLSRRPRAPSTSSPINSPTIPSTPVSSPDGIPINSTWPGCSPGEDALLDGISSHDGLDWCEPATEATFFNSPTAKDDSEKNDTRTSSQLSTGASTALSWGRLWSFDFTPTSRDTDSEDETAELPMPCELGDSPFLLFVALALLIEERNKLIDSKLDYNEIFTHFDKKVRKHDASRVLDQARRLYSSFLSGTNVKEKS